MEGHGTCCHARVLTLRLLSVAALLAFATRAFAQVVDSFPNTLPKATITSDGTTARESEPAAANDLPAPIATSAAPANHGRHHVVRSEPTYSAAVEPTHAMLKLKKDTWVFASPAASSSTVERAHADKFVNVTGSTRYYAQVKLKSGATGYVPLSAIELTRPEDKIMRLSTDAAVLSQPNRYGQKLAEVHQAHDVHVIGISMNYIKIRMKSGLEGFIPLTATE
jgi:uncharacterized protein YgiM (DUF1202 family)